MPKYDNSGKSSARLGDEARTTPRIESGGNDTAEVPSSFHEDRSSPRKALKMTTKGSVDSAEDPQQEKLRREIEEVYRNLEMIMRTEDLKPEERAQLEEEIRKYK